ncbi:MAG TPA: phosphoribosylformylglycinamidine synthase subunit PurS [Firmicutes bacterium]|nr:phosphoribosylformylglycinamidine synthase subunit PurS [Bacillota bacterium]
MYKAEIKVLLKQSVLDPQGQAVEKALATLSYDNVEHVRIGKYMEVTLRTNDRAAAEAQVREMCERLLANTVIEDYTFALAEV